MSRSATCRFGEATAKTPTACCREENKFHDVLDDCITRGHSYLFPPSGRQNDTTFVELFCKQFQEAQVSLGLRLRDGAIAMGPVGMGGSSHPSSGRD